jgi:hypothetical protein
MPKVVSVTAKPGYVLALRFDDGIAGDILIADRLFGPSFEPLRDEALFAQVTIDQFGAVSWGNGVDLDPQALYVRVREMSLEAGYKAMAADEEREKEAKDWIDG